MPAILRRQLNGHRLAQGKCLPELEIGEYHFGSARLIGRPEEGDRRALPHRQVHTRGLEALCTHDDADAGRRGALDLVRAAFELALPIPKGKKKPKGKPKKS